MVRWLLLFGLLACTLLSFSASGAGQTTGTTVTVFSYQKSASPLHSHTWIVFSDGTTISWMPRGNTGLLTAPQPGTNWTHAKTLTYATSIHASVRQWGPYPCSPALIARARLAVKQLEDGAILYSCFDAARPRGTNCVHAAMLPLGGCYQAAFLYGFRAGEYVAKRYMEAK